MKLDISKLCRMLYFFTIFLLFSHLASPPRWWSNPDLPVYLPAHAQHLKKLHISSVRETGSKQSSSPSHSRRDTLIADMGRIKGEDCQRFQQVSEGKMLKGRQAERPPTFDDRG